MSRLEPPRRQQAERHAPVRRGLVRRRHLRLGQPQAGAPARHRVPGHHRRDDLSGRRARPTSSSRSPGRSSGRSAPSHGWRSSSRRRRTRCRWSSPSSRSGRTCRRRRPRSSRRWPGPRCPRPRRRPSRPSTSTPPRWSSRRSPRPAPEGLEEAATIARREIVPEIAGIEGVARADLTGGLETRLAVTLDPDQLAATGVSTQQIVGVLGANNLTLPSGQLSADGTRTPVSTIGATGHRRGGRGARRRLRRHAAERDAGDARPARHGRARLDRDDRLRRGRTASRR